MRVTLTRRGDYAVRAVYDVALHHPERRKASEIASDMAIPRGFVTQILAALVQAGILEATAGRAGGYVLAGTPESLTLRQVVAAAEGEMTLDRCVLRGGPCDWDDRCPVHDVWAEAQRAFAARLEATTFASLVAPGR